MPSVSLQRISTVDLQMLARSEMPAALHGLHAAGALPPAFAAQRALALQAAEAARPLAGALYYVCQGDRVVGSCGFKDAADEGWVEVGYGVAAGYQGCGVGTQALRALCSIAFEGGQIHAVRACIEPDNAASAALARKLGFVAGSLVIEEDGSCVMVWTLLAAS
jgi:RimJ/RimL family protein N-acetyltransferase